MSGQEFDALGLALGVVTGARAFNVDSLGRLTGIHYRQVWRPGENVAECRKKDDPYGLSSFAFTFLYGGSEPVAQPKPKLPLQHSRETCACGFYGYYDGSNDYHDKGRVSGVIEAYGDVLIGTRGFRAAKARIVALRIPKSVPDRVAALVRRNYAGVPFFPTFSAMVAEFPPDAGGMESSPTSDPDFWTRVI